ncbi:MULTISPECIES: hypothetical protein [Actinomycetes]|jgi:hypothetical protein|uniref:Uncharacterized protein n=1 Tax=Williamsia marianensis TaxID=85044 RepID=A0ABU4F041_WILMA|nr:MULTISPECIES: hypothetical protein [Actinomycetes]MCK0515838.1 hypothetical protein [Williamsia sp. DF01-3]MDV7136880.1 hypothetical protein [Williamsia muralis]PZU02669.1 MAG: hypothetical protein DI630_07280 [Gordonia sp. (in: high G+C Gram-positive bacteria)]
MARRSLGPRKGYLVRVPEPVDLQALAQEAGYSAYSRYAADVFCEKAGRPDLMIGPDLKAAEQQLRLPA